MKQLMIAMLAMTMVMACKSGRQANVENKQCIDTVLQAQTEAILKECMADSRADSGQVLVMEVPGQTVVASAGWAANGRAGYVKTDFSDQRWHTKIGRIADYLAMLETGNLTLHDSADTGNGLLKVGGYQIKDYNWRRGGYGMMDVKSGIIFLSEIVYFKCLEKTYGTNKALERIVEGNAMSMKEMAKMTSDLIARSDTYAHEIRNVTEAYVEEGLGIKAKPDKGDMAGYAGTTCGTDSIRHLDFCGYFPVAHPQYIVVASMKKRGLPASADNMCAPVARRVAEFLFDLLPVRDL